ncbi:tight adherence protein C [Thermotomaculum hydrothermale]|uniref:Tight adherence protein C n=1 Tax=Thermotomaculum hydrothermale TaxID=981385 RepID=A0A7R6PX82_9BACT|nr:type II secretion system F family protein [Thermotomaculum hydrothermale]BBB32330.1 tight adherence protein C [Thermotomaculum hydrothermale]
MNPQIYFILATVFLFIAIFLLFYYFLPTEAEVEEFRKQLPTGHLENKKMRTFEESPVMKALYPVIIAFAARAKKMNIPQKYIDLLERRIAAAGYPYGFTSYEYIGYATTIGFIVTVLAAFFTYSMFGSINFIFLIIAFVFGNVFPYFFLANQADERKIKIYKDIPYKLDLLSMAVEAGLDFLSAVKRMVEKDSTKSPLVEEFFQFLQEVRMGKTKQEALLDLAKRADVEALNSIVTAIIQAEKMGTPVAQVLRIQAESLRISRSQKAEKAAGEASVKIMFPLVFILISTVLILFGGIIVKWVRGELF